MKRTILLLSGILLLLSITMGSAWIVTNPVSQKTAFQNDQQQKNDTTMKVVYTCSMHPEVVQNKPGKCPKCGMALIKKEVIKDVYTCPMHPEVKQDKPGKCPKCGMNLVKKESADKPARKSM